jgi:ASPIC and UnbV
LRREIGVGSATSIDEIIISWPTSRLIQHFKNVAVNQFIKLKEGDDNYQQINTKNLPMHKSNSIPMCAPAKLVQ